MPEPIDVAAQTIVLIKLQEIDTRIYKLNEAKAKKPLELAQLEAEFKQKAIGVKKAEDNFTAVQLKKKEKEGALNTKEEQIKKLQGQLSQLKTNKEYAAMQQEINGQKADKSLVEDEILALMDGIDTAKLEIAKEKGLLAQEEAALKEWQAKVKAELQDIEKSLQESSAARLAIIPQVDKNTLKKYEKILAGKNGRAIVPVHNDACQGCHMNLPPQVINKIQMKQEFIICENCTRFLYINESV